MGLGIWKYHLVVSITKMINQYPLIMISILILPIINPNSTSIPTKRINWWSIFNKHKNKLYNSNPKTIIKLINRLLDSKNWLPISSFKTKGSSRSKVLMILIAKISWKSSNLGSLKVVQLIRENYNQEV